MTECSVDRVERLVYGELEPSEAAEMRMHLAECEACADEHAWLVQERKAFAAASDRREAPPFEAIERSVSERRRERSWKRAGSYLAGALALAATVWLVAGWVGAGSPEHAFAPPSAAGRMTDPPPRHASVEPLMCEAVPASFASPAVAEPVGTSKSCPEEDSCSAECESTTPVLWSRDDSCGEP